MKVRLRKELKKIESVNGIFGYKMKVSVHN